MSKTIIESIEFVEQQIEDVWSKPHNSGDIQLYLAKNMLMNIKHNLKENRKGTDILEIPE